MESEVKVVKAEFIEQALTGDSVEICEHSAVKEEMEEIEGEQTIAVSTETMVSPVEDDSVLGLQSWDADTVKNAPKKSNVDYYKPRATPRTYKCNDCGIAFRHLSLLRNHEMMHKKEVMQSGGSQDNRPTCDICGANFKLPGELRSHKIWVHWKNVTEKQNDQCPRVGTRLKLQDDLSAPGTLTQPRDEPVKVQGSKYESCDCANIGEKTSSVKLCTCKNRRDTLKVQNCVTCGKVFTDACLLKGHSRSAAGEKRFRCDVCEMGFAELVQLKTHVQVHAEEVPMQCDICKKMFKRRSSLWNHRRMHLGEGRFQCEVCGLSFNKRQYLRTHVKTHIEQVMVASSVKREDCLSTKGNTCEPT